MDKWKYRFFIIIAFIIGYWLSSVMSNYGYLFYIGSNEIKYQSAYFGILLDPKE